jgi:hypothetical protein
VCKSAGLGDDTIEPGVLRALLSAVLRILPSWLLSCMHHYKPSKKIKTEPCTQREREREREREGELGERKVEQHHKPSKTKTEPCTQKEREREREREREGELGERKVEMGLRKLSAGLRETMGERNGKKN